MLGHVLRRKIIEAVKISKELVVVVKAEKEM